MQKYLDKNTNINVILYNNLNNIETGVDILIDNYVRLYEFGLTLSGFQFIGLTLEQTSSNNTSILWSVSYFLLSMCFLFSLFGSTISYIAVKYLNTIKHEHKEFILAGIYSYRRIFMFIEVVPYLNSAIFLISINLLTHINLNLTYALVFNIFSVILFIVGWSLTGIMNFRSQNYKPFEKKISRKRSIAFDEV